MTGNIQIKAVTPPSTLSEGPYWEESYGSLLYVDISAGYIRRYFPQSNRHQSLKIHPAPTRDSVSFVIPCEGEPSLLLIGHGGSVAAVRWSPNDADHGSSNSHVITTVDKDKHTRFNDAKCDPHGRLWAGTMGFETAPGKPEMYQGSLYRFTNGLEAIGCLDKICLSNGIGFSPDLKSLYYIDTLALKVEGFDYDANTGEISNRYTIVDYPELGLTPDLPDGMAVDIDGNVWVANFFGQKIICINPKEKSIIRTIKTPVPNFTSVCWGGSDYSTLFCTSSKLGLSPKQLKEYPESGSVFQITGLGTKGLPPVPVTLDTALKQKILDQLK